MLRNSAQTLMTLLAAGVLLLSGCASVKYEQDFKPGTTFSQHQTFAWRSASDGLNAQVAPEDRIENADRVRLRRLTQAELEQRGYRYQAEDADLLIDITALTRISTGRSTGLGLSVGLPVGRSGSIGVGGSRALDNQKEEGVILVDITDASTNTLIWRGSAEAIPLSHFALRAEDQLSNVLKQLLAQFPPE